MNSCLTSITNMKSSTSTGKLFATASNAKAKKNIKDREKRKSQSATELPNNQPNPEKTSPNKEGNTRKYAGYGPEQLMLMAEQTLLEHLSEDVCSSFTEDINYKLRQVIYDALGKARLCGRNCITSTDINDTFECLQIEKVYGASSSPNWFTFGEQNLHYLDDTKINLVEISESQASFIQPHNPIVTQKWVPESSDVSKELRQYFNLMCQAVIDKDKDVCSTALKDISENTMIGPIIEYFYQFAYLLLSKDITYDCLTLCAFDLLEALESNPHSPFVVSEKTINLLARLLLQRLLKSVTMLETLKRLCQVLARLSFRIPIRKMVLKKLVCKFPEIREDFALPVMCAINELGLDAIYAIFFPHMNYLLSMCEEDQDTELVQEVLRTYIILCSEGLNLDAVCDEYFETFGNAIIPIWKQPHIDTKDQSKPEHIWLNIKKQLVQSMWKFFPNTTKTKISVEEAFPEDEGDDVKEEMFEYEFENRSSEEAIPTAKPGISFKFHNFTPAVGRAHFLKQQQINTHKSANYVIIGKRTLLAPVLNSLISRENTKCTDHSIMFYNL